MSEIGFSSISTPGLSRDIVNKPFKNSYSFISENAYMKSEGENKEVAYLKKTVSRLEQNMNFIQHEHCQMLEGLQKQIDKLREENQDLQFQLVMRSDRVKDFNSKTLSKAKDSNQNNTNLIPDQLHNLKQELDDEKRKNKELLQQLEILKNKSEETSKEIQYVDMLEPVTFTNNSVIISPDIRISLNPLAVSTFQHESGSFVMKTPLTVQDCEMVIQTLLQKIDCTPIVRENSVSSRSISGNQRLKLIPGIKKPLQPIKPMSRGSSSIKLTSLTGSQTVKNIGLPSTQKLIPILSHKNETIKLEHDAQGFTISRKSERDHKILDNLPMCGEGKIGSSLPALPKPNDFNQAEKHRRLHVLQKKRLDQYNNRS